MLHLLLLESLRLAHLTDVVHFLGHLFGIGNLYAESTVLFLKPRDVSLHGSLSIGNPREAFLNSDTIQRPLRAERSVVIILQFLELHLQTRQPNLPKGTHTLLQLWQWVLRWQELGH